MLIVHHFKTSMNFNSDMQRKHLEGYSRVVILFDQPNLTAQVNGQVPDNDKFVRIQLTCPPSVKQKIRSFAYAIEHSQGQLILDILYFFLDAQLEWIKKGFHVYFTNLRKHVS